MNLSLNEVSFFNCTPFNKRVIAVVAALANIIKSSIWDFKVKSSRKKIEASPSYGDPFNDGG